MSGDRLELRMVCTFNSCERVGQERVARLPDLGDDLYLSGAIRCGACGLLVTDIRRPKPTEGGAAGGQL